MSAEPETRLAKLPFIPASPCGLIIKLEQEINLTMNATSEPGKKEDGILNREN